jgi:hypothetical protein
MKEVSPIPTKMVSPNQLRNVVYLLNTAKIGAPRTEPG